MTRRAKQYTAEQVKEAVSKSTYKGEAIRNLGIENKSSNGYKILSYLTTIYDIDCSHFSTRVCNPNPTTAATPIQEIFDGNHPLYSRKSLKLRLVREGYMTNDCAVCGLGEWRGKPIPVELDHINGVSWDNRLENLRIVCRNCHGQTETFCGKNKRRRNSIRKSRDEHFAEKRKTYEESQTDYIVAVREAEIDYSKWGWASKVAEIIGQKPQKVRVWMKRFTPDLLDGARTQNNKPSACPRSQDTGQAD